MAQGQKIGFVFVNEFVCTMVIGIAVFSVLDPSNSEAPSAKIPSEMADSGFNTVFITPSSGPLLIGAIYFVCIVCFAPNSIALNTARDLGGRFAAGMSECSVSRTRSDNNLRKGAIWGSGAFPAGYSALAALTNIAGTLVGAAFQVFVLSDSNRPPTAAHVAAAASTVPPVSPGPGVGTNGKAEAGYIEQTGSSMYPTTSGKAETGYVEHSDRSM